MNNWYDRIREEIKAQYADDWKLFCDLLAATSPRKQVSANWKLADKIYRHCSGFTESSWRGTLPNLGVMTSQIPNVIRALKREPLSGPKVQAFAANLKGDMSKVTVDVWMLKLFNYDKPSAKAREEVTEYVLRAAAEMGCEPAEVQAEMWEYSVRRAGRKPKSYMVAAVKQRQLEFDWENEDEKEN